MDNEAYLIASYFTVGGISIVLGCVTWLVLRRPFAGTVAAFPNRRLAGVLRPLFFWGLVLPAVLGFLSVSYYGCKVDTYGKIIEKRSYLVGKNHEQAEAILHYVVTALFVWAVIAGIGILIRRHKLP